jgi:hypothetical protein
MRIGFRMRQQAIAAVHAKVLRLNSAAVVSANSGRIVNLVSNDVRRFDDLAPFWCGRTGRLLVRPHAALRAGRLAARGESGAPHIFSTSPPKFPQHPSEP